MQLSQKVARIVILVLAATVVSIVPGVASAQQNAGDMNRTELANFGAFLDTRPQMRIDLQNNPALVNDASYLQKHQDLQAFLKSHPGVQQELRKNPATAVREESSYQAAGAKGQVHMQAALRHLQEARAELEKAEQDKGGHRLKALQLTEQAGSEVQRGMNYDTEHEGH